MSVGYHVGMCAKETCFFLFFLTARAGTEQMGVLSADLVRARSLTQSGPPSEGHCTSFDTLCQSCANPVLTLCASQPQLKESNEHEKSGHHLIILTWDFPWCVFLLHGLCHLVLTLCAWLVPPAMRLSEQGR